MWSYQITSNKNLKKISYGDRLLMTQLWSYAKNNSVKTALLICWKCHLNAKSVELSTVNNAWWPHMKDHAIRISSFSSNSGKDVRNVKYLYKKLRDATIWPAIVLTNFVLFVLKIGLLIIINALMGLNIVFSLEK